MSGVCSWNGPLEFQLKCSIGMDLLDVGGQDEARDPGCHTSIPTETLKCHVILGHGVMFIRTDFSGDHS